MAKSVSPCRVRQAPPEVRCWILTGLTARLASLLVKGTERSVANLRIMSSNRRKPGDQGSCFVSEAGVQAVVIGVAAGECAVVVVADLFEGGFIEGFGAAVAGLDGGVVGVGQGGGHRGGPQLPVGVGIGDRPQVAQQVSCAPGVNRGQVGVAGVAVSDEHAGEAG